MYAIPECVIVEIGIQTHSICTNSKNKLVHNLPCGVLIDQKMLWKNHVGSLISRILSIFSGFAEKKIANLDFGLYSWEVTEMETI